MSQVIHPIGQDTLAFSVCKDHKLRIWSCKVTLNLFVFNFAVDLTTAIPYFMA